jgi:hypothetical protein
MESTFQARTPTEQPVSGRPCGRQRVPDRSDPSAERDSSPWRGDLLAPYTSGKEVA